MRRQVNARLLLWTIVGAIVVVVVVAIVHDAQFRRNVDVLMRRAEQALKEEQLDLAAHYLEQYLVYQPHDTAALIAYARTLNKIADTPGLEYEAFLVMEQATRRAPHDLELHREAAQLAQQVTRFAEAADHFRVLLDAAPKDAQLWQNLGWCQECQGQFDQAEASYHKSIDCDPTLLESYARLGNLLLRRDRSAEALAVLDHMVAANPKSVAALMARADYLAATGRTLNSLLDIDQAYTLAPTEFAIIMAKAGMEEKKGDLVQARAALVQGLKHHPDNVALYQTLVRIELKDGQPAQALYWLNEQVKRQPQDLTLYFQVFDLALSQDNPQASAEALAALKKAEGETGHLWRYAEAAWLVNFAGPKDAAKLQLAQQRLGEVKKLQPSWNQPLVLEGLLEELAGHKAKAVALYQEALKLGPIGPAYLFRLAELLTQQRDYAGAAAALVKIEDQAKLTPMQARLGAELALKLHDLPRAVTLARLAVAKDARDYRDHLWQAKVLSLAGQPAEAETVLRHLAKSSPAVPDVWITLVERLALSGKQAEAGSMLLQVPAHLPAAKSTLTLARCREAMGELKQAEELFQAYVLLDEDNFLGWKHLAEFYLRHQQYAKAEPWLRKLMDPNHPVPPDLDQSARRQLAVALARQNDAGKYDEATKLLAGVGKSPADKVAQALVLATKSAQRTQAIALMEQARQQQPLPHDAALALAQWYRQAGQPAKAAAVLHDLLTDEGDTPDSLAEYIRCLLARHDIVAAQTHLDRLQQLWPGDPALSVLQQLLKKSKAP